jgi:hypothetical protein
MNFAPGFIKKILKIGSCRAKCKIRIFLSKKSDLGDFATSQKKDLLLKMKKMTLQLFFNNFSKINKKIKNPRLVNGK